MTVTDLIMELAKLPPEMEVIFQKDQNEEGFKMEVVEALGEVITDDGRHYILLNPGSDENDENEE